MDFEPVYIDTYEDQQCIDCKGSFTAISKCDEGHYYCDNCKLPEQTKCPLCENNKFRRVDMYDSILDEIMDNLSVDSDEEFCDIITTEVSIDSEKEDILLREVEVNSH